MVPFNNPGFGQDGHTPFGGLPAELPPNRGGRRPESYGMRKRRLAREAGNDGWPDPPPPPPPMATTPKRKMLLRAAKDQHRIDNWYNPKPFIL